MSTLKTNNVQVGQSVTATNNFTIYQPSTPDGTVRIGVGNSGATTADVLTANSSGNVGVGTSSPTARLQLVNSSANCGVIIDGQNATARGAFINLKKGGTDTAYIGQASAILGGASTSNDLLLWADGSINQLFYINGTERARIDSSGNLLVGTTSTSKTAQGVHIYTGTADFVRGAGNDCQNFFNSGTGTRVGQIIVNASTTTYSTSSDYRLKEDVLPMTGALAKVAQLKPCTYKWKADGSNGEGFIAHELQAVCPDAVTGEKDAVDSEGNIKPQGIDTSFLVATLTAAIQEQQAMIEELKAKVAVLEAK